MVSCAARGCKNRGRRGSKVTYHVFPKNGELRKKWIPVTGRKNWTPGMRAVLCSDHFEEPCFDRTGQTTRLRVGAIPTIGKFAPKNKKTPIFMNMELDNYHRTHPVTKTVSVKAGITTRSGRQLSPRRIPAAAGATMIKKELCEFEEEVTNFDDPPAPPAPPASEPANGNRTEEATAETPPTAHPDHFYCRTQSEMDALLKKSEQKIEYLKMKLDFLSSPNRSEKQEPPDWPQYRRELLQKEADQIRAMVKAGKKPVINIKINSEDLTDGDEQLRERQKEAEDLQRQIKTLQQKSRRQKSKSKAKFIRCVVMIEPTNKSGKKGTAGPDNNALHEGEEEAAQETEVPPVVDKVSSLHDSILSHTASMVVGPNGLLNEKDKKIRDLQKKLKISKLKEKRRMEQLEHLQEVIEFLKERCPEYSSQKEPVPQRHCSLCHLPLLKRCHRVAEYWAAPNVIEGQFSVPLLQLKPAVCHAVPLSQLKSHGLWSLKKQHWPWLSNRSLLCFFCRALVQRGRLKQRSLVHSLRPQC